MLSSHISSVQMASTSLQSSCRVSTALIRSTGSLPQRCRSQQQSRSFRLGLWSSYLDPDFQKEARRRYRVVKHKQIEALYRKLSWDRHFPGHPKHLNLKGFMCSAWRSQASRPGGRWVDVDELFNDKGGMQRGTESGIEDVEQSALDSLIKKRFNFERSRLHTISSWNRTESPETESKDQATYASSLYDLEAFQKRFQSNNESDTSSHPDYEIDPITNRKVFKDKSDSSTDSGRKKIETPVKTFKGYRSQFHDLHPPSVNASDILQKDFKGSWPRRIPLDSDTGNIPETLQEHGNENPRRGDPTDFGTRDFGKKVFDPAKGYEQYDRKVDYKSGQFYDPSSISTNQRDPVQKGLKDYDNQISKGLDSAKCSVEADHFEEVDPVQEGLKEYDSKVNYASGEFYTPAACKNIDYSDPDQCGLKEYDNKISNGDAIEDTASSRKGAVNPKANAKTSKPVAKDGWEEYDSEVDYKSGQFYEPGRTAIDYSDPIQGGLKDYDGKISREGLPSEPVLEAADPITEAFKEYEDHKKPEEKMRPLDPVEEAFRGYDPVHQDLKDYEYERSGEAQSDPAREALKDYDSRTNYGPKGAVGIPMTSSGFLGRVRGAMDKLLGDSKGNFDQLKPSNVVAGSRPGKAPKETDAEKLAKREQLENDFDKLQRGVSADEAAAVDKVKKHRKLAENVGTRAESISPDGFEASESSRRAQKLADSLPEGFSGYIQCGEGLLEVNIQNNANGLDVAKLSSRKLTGNFARDFPEEFETSWTVDQSSPGGLIPKKKVSSSEAERQTESKVQRDENTWYNSEISSKEAFSNNPETPRIETSLDRTVTRNAENDSNRSSGTEKSKKDNHRKLVREVRQIYEDAYGTIDSQHRHVAGVAGALPPNSAGMQKGSQDQEFNATESGSENEPMVYKILAYDPTMQSINIAETTSIVPDSSGPLTPAEVLLRLSNPAKFFPHFLPLQSEGYEIVSGSGDVLVFRKVRSGAPPGSDVEVKSAASEKLQKYKATNPIDGMQSSPVAPTGNFASPTGFVNHDLPVSEPPFKSNIDVRREEPVFSGKRNWEDESEGPRRKERGRVKKVLIGGAWVAAASYAVGVVAEFFKTGGSDGKGPQGF